MADEYQAGICSGSWWSAARSGGFDGQAMSAVTASAACSTEIADVGGPGFSWAATEMVESGATSSAEPVGSASGSSVTFQDPHKTHVLDFMDSTMDWTQALLSSGGSFQQDLSSRPIFRRDPSTIDSDQVQAGSGDSLVNPFNEMNDSFILDQHRLSSGNGPIDTFQLAPASYGCATAALQSDHDNRVVNYQSPMLGYRESSSEFPRPEWSQSNNQLHFSNNTPFWNASAAAAAANEVRSGFYPPRQTVKLNSEGARGSSSSAAKKGCGSEPALKKLRIETPSPLPTFKVRKEKLGDRITALQQLVSPFGKTDTASVLHEAIDYIKFLHNQVSVLSTPYLKNGHPMQHQPAPKQNHEKSNGGEEPKQDLRSRGLCLVPMASTYPMASETPMDFWTPTFGGTFR